MDKQLTGNDLVREYFPEASDDFCEMVLWGQTCFPCRVGTFEQSLEHWRLQIAKFKCNAELLCGGPFEEC